MVPAGAPGHAIEQRRVAEVRVHRDAGLAERVALAEVVAVIGAQHDRGVVPELLRVELVEDAAEPVVDHRQLRLVVGADLARLRRLQPALGDGLGRVRRPDEPRAFPRVVVTRRPRRRRVERLVRIELVDEQQEALVVARARAQPLLGRAASCADRGSPPRRGTMCASRRRGGARTPGAAGSAGVPVHDRIGARAPRVTFVTSHVLPRAEVGVVVLAADLEQVRMVGHEHRRDPRPPQLVGDRVFPDLDRAPRPPEEVERADEQVVAGRHARQRSRPVPVEPQ